MSLGALNAALSGLRISQQQLNVISNNVSNVNTEGYTRKILPQTAQAINGITVGVRSENIIRNVDLTLSRDVWTQVSASSNLSTRVQYLEQIERFHGGPNAEASFAAEIAALRDSFSALSDSPEDSFLQAAAVNQAVDTANKINSMANMIVQLRNDAQNEMEQTVERINGYLNQIADLNAQIKFQISMNRSPAQLQDFRDDVVKKLSSDMQVSFFTRGDGVMVVQTPRGEQLVDEIAQELVFDPRPLSAKSFYQPGGGVAGLFLRGDPLTTPGGLDLTRTELGGKIGQLLELRDQTLPAFTAQIDEVAYRMAQRFHTQGLMLFTDNSGTIPADTPPTLEDPGPPAVIPATPVNYVGFASAMRVNGLILADNSLIQSGTAITDLAIQSGSNEVIRRVLEFSFGNTEYQQAIGSTTVDLRDATAGVGVDMQTRLGVYSTNTVQGSLNITSYGSIDDAGNPPAMVTVAAGLLDPPNDVFRITIDGVDLDIDLSTAAANNPIGGAVTNAADQITAEINTQIAASALPAGYAIARVGPSGQLIIETRGDVTIDATTVPNGMGQGGLTFLGLSEATYEAKDPYFDVQVGNDPMVRIYIEPGDMQADLIDKLILSGGTDTSGVPGLAYDDVTFAATGQLILRPGDNYSNPAFGGDLKVIAGDFYTGLPSDNLYTAPGLAPLAAVTANGQRLNIVSALFGSFADDAAAGTNYIETSPVTDVAYGAVVSDQDASTVSFRTRFLGPNANININILGSETLIDFGQKILSKQMEQLTLAKNSYEDEESFKQTLERQLMDESGVNIDEELSYLIVVQTAYSAAARAISAIDQQFRELIDSFR